MLTIASYSVNYKMKSWNIIVSSMIIKLRKNFNSDVC